MVDNLVGDQELGQEELWGGELFGEAAKESQRKAQEQPHFPNPVPNTASERWRTIHAGILQQYQAPSLLRLLLFETRRFASNQLALGVVGIAFWIASTIVRASEPFKEAAAK